MSDPLFSQGRMPIVGANHIREREIVFSDDEAFSFWMLKYVMKNIPIGWGSLYSLYLLTHTREIKRGN
jgi:hypothetical protein